MVSAVRSRGPLRRRCALLFIALSIVIGAAHADPKRQIPDYDGRGNEDAKPDAPAWSWALWIPRVVLWPVYALDEYVLRRPLGALVTYAERKHWVNAVTDLFTFSGSGSSHLILPTVLFDFGLLPSVGLYYAGDHILFDGNAIRLHAATWGSEWINATALERYTQGATEVSARVEFKRQADLLFLGAGPDGTPATRARYGLQRLEAGATIVRGVAGESSLTLSSGIRTIAYRPGNCCGDPSLDARIADGTLMAPLGYGVPYTALYQRAALVLDTRRPRPAGATGGYLEMHAETNVDVENDRSWIGYGAVIGFALDLHSRQRTIKLQIAADYTDPLHGEVVPFNELASLGGNLMPGFVAGWMTGRSTFAAQIGYSWPVWMFLDGQARFSVGNSFGPHLDDLTPTKLRLSWDIGFNSIGKRDEGIELLVGLGTETIEHGVDASSVRISVGSRRGF